MENNEVHPTSDFCNDPEIGNHAGGVTVEFSNGSKIHVIASPHKGIGISDHLRKVLSEIEPFPAFDMAGPPEPPPNCPCVTEGLRIIVELRIESATIEKTSRRIIAAIESETGGLTFLGCDTSNDTEAVIQFFADPEKWEADAFLESALRSIIEKDKHFAAYSLTIRDMLSGECLGDVKKDDHASDALRYMAEGYKQAEGRTERTQVAADLDLQGFAELFADVSAGVYSDNCKKGWWDDPEKTAAQNALDAFKAAELGHKSRIIDLPDEVKAAVLKVRDIAQGVADREKRNDFEAMMLIVTEIAEAAESRRKGLSEPDDKIPEFSGIEAELADAVIRIMDMSAARGWRVGEAIAAKVKFNRTRPFRHGHKLA